MVVSDKAAGTPSKRTVYGGPVVHVEYAARTRPTKKDQDCFFIVPHGAQGLTCGITDGHSVHRLSDGRQHAEAAAQHLGSDLWKRIGGELLAAGSSSMRSEGSDGPEAVSNGGNGSPATASGSVSPRVVHVSSPPDAEEGLLPPPLAAAVTESFLVHQRRCEGRYDRDVADRLLAKKRELEEELGETLPLELPQEGGTTATALVLHARGLFVAWVGDSRAVLAVDGEVGPGSPTDDADGTGTAQSHSPQLHAVALTTDHNTLDVHEKARLEANGGRAGGEAMSGHVSVPNAEGSLKVTRSLGDSPFHKGDAVSAEPGMAHVPLSASTRFVVVASDGIWDHLSNEKVVEIVAAALHSHSRPGHAGAGPPMLEKQRSNGPVSAMAAAAACDAVLDHIDRGQESGSLNAGLSDDRSILVLVLTRQP